MRVLIWILALPLAFGASFLAGAIGWLWVVTAH